MDLVVPITIGIRGLCDLPLIIKWMKGHDQDYCIINLLPNQYMQARKAETIYGILFCSGQKVENSHSDGYPVFDLVQDN
jgi:hypothetical protein